MALALARQHINTLVPALDIQAGRVLPAAENIQSVHVKADILGAAENVLNNHLQVHHLQVLHLQVLAVLRGGIVVGVHKQNAMIIQCIVDRE